MDSANPSPVRVLIRPPSSLTPTTSSSSTIPSVPPPDPPPPSPSHSLHPRPSENVVVVGFIGRRPDDVSHLANRILDLNAFGSGNLDKGFGIEKEEAKRWFESRRISYYHDEEKGILFLQYCSAGCPAMEGLSPTDCGFDSALEEREFGDLQGMLFMFAVCHVIIYIQEGSRFDTQVLKKFRVLQAAKHSLAPFVRSRTTSTSTSRPPSSRQSFPASSSNNPSPGRGGGSSSRNTSSISLMSGLGSYASLFPGQCNPVTLFVFLDDFSDVLNPTSSVDEPTDNSFNQSSNLNNLARPSLPTKGSGSVVVLARPGSKSEGGFRKKLQSSLEAQIRFLIKKCRTLTGSETHSASRGGGISSSAPLFSLDASRAVSLLDRSANQKGESLEFAIGLVEDVLNGKATSDSLLLESHSQNANKEDILSVKEFIYRQSDILRGKGGLVTNTNSGSAAGVGMVAAAAAAAAASTASGKTFTTPELPSLETWLSSSQLILQGLFSAKRGCLDEIEMTKRKPRQRNNAPPQNEGISTKGVDPLDIAVSWLESGKELNMKFSTVWCERALPAAKEVYLKDLPALYPTSLHESHLEKTLNAFRSMVKGPAVQLFTKKLEDECTSIWRSGRQLCDAISLTGKPCMHQRHDTDTSNSPLGTAVKPHSSGFFFLHACACGRSRKLRADPFDFETANITSNCFPDCDKFLPAFQLPKISNAGPVQPLSWSLIRIGGAKYYEPSKGLLQSGFHATQKFLLKWVIYLEKHKIHNGSPLSSVQQGSLIRSSVDPNVDLNANLEIERAGAFESYQQDAQNAVEHERKPLEIIKSDDKKISFGRGFPNFTMRKPFSEVVAGSATTGSGFPPLQQMKQPSLGSEKGSKQSSARDRNVEKVREVSDFQGSQKSEEYSSALGTLNGINANSYKGSDPFLQIGSNLIPVNINGSGSIKLSTSLKNAAVYVGFEHECPHGHRFILTPQHLNELGSSYSFLEDSHLSTSMENLDQKVANPSKSVRNGGHGKAHRRSNGMAATATNKLRNFDKSKDTLANGSQHLDARVQSSGLGREQKVTSIGLTTLPNSVKDLRETMQSFDLNDGGGAFPLLNRNIPIYMNCPHCKFSKNKKDPSIVKFAGTISQLQRVFLVTPPFPVVLATCPVVQFEASCLPQSIPERDKQLQFSLGCRVILPPESFLTLRFPFVYGVQLEDKSLLPLNPFDHQPELTAWITKGTTLQIISRGSNLNDQLET